MILDYLYLLVNSDVTISIQGQFFNDLIFVSEYKPTLSSLDGTSQSSEKDGILHDNVDKKAMIKDDVTEKTEIKNDHTKVQNGFAKGTNYENGRSNSEFHLRQSKHGSKELGNDRKRRLPDAKKHQQVLVA